MRKYIYWILPIVLSIYQLYLINRIWDFSVNISFLIEVILIVLMYTSFYLFYRKIKIKNISKKSFFKVFIVSLVLSSIILISNFSFFTKSYRETNAKIYTQNEQANILMYIRNIYFDNVLQDVFKLNNNNVIELNTKNQKNITIVFQGSEEKQNIIIEDGDNTELVELNNTNYVYKIKSNDKFDFLSIIRLILSFTMIEIISLLICIASYHNYKKDKSIIIPVLALIGLIRFFLYKQCQLCVKYEDSYEYYFCSLATIMKTGVLQSRVPIYPFFIEFIEWICNDKWEIFVCIIQMITSFISLIYLYKTLCLLCKRNILNALIVYLYGTSTAVLGWDTNILTESFSLSLVIIFMYLLIKYLKTNKLKYGISSTVITMMLCFLKPSTIAFLPLLICFYTLKIFLEKNNRKINIKCLISVIALIGIILVYSFVFYKQYKIFSITDASVRQNLYICIHEGFYKNSGDNQFIQDAEKAIRESKTKWEAVNTILHNYDNERIIMLNKVSKKHSMKQYIKYIIRIIIEQTNTKFTSYYLLIVPDTFYSIQNVILKVIEETFVIKFITIFIITAIEGAVSFYKWIKERRPPWVHLGLFGFVLIILITAFIGTNAEFMRTSLCSLPFIYISIGTIINDILEKFTTSKKYVLTEKYNNYNKI